MNSPTEQHLSAALRDLVAEQPFTPDVSAIEHRVRQARRHDRLVRGGIGAGVIAVAAAAAIGVASAVPSAPAGTAQAGGTHAASTGAPAKSVAAQPPLMTLAADVAAEPRPVGDATLINRQTTITGQATVSVWDLYTDNGRYFFAKTEAGLPAQVNENNNQGDGIFGREVAAAVYAVHGNLQDAALKMAWAADTTPVPGWLSAQLKNISAKGGAGQIDNYVWENSQDALIAGAGNPQVRAGVLRLLSLLPDVTITHGTANGQPTLTLTAGAAEFTDPRMAALQKQGILKEGPKADNGWAYQEALTINADTGMPVKFVGGTPSNVSTTVNYVVTRVTLADIAAGKF
jgi:hypothetical protein